MHKEQTIVNCEVCDIVGKFQCGNAIALGAPSLKHGQHFHVMSFDRGQSCA